MQTVTAISRWVVPIVDGADQEPDLIPVDSGVMRITSLNAFAQLTGLPTSPGTSATAGVAVFDIPIDSDGWAHLPGQVGVRVPDFTRPGVNPQVESGKATHRIEIMNARVRSGTQNPTPVKFEAFNVRLAADTIGSNGYCNINELAPLPTAGGTPIIVGPSGAQGKSAYQVAVEGGYVGTEAAWLASLKGDTGGPGVGIPTGGATGQVLVKSSGGDYATAFVALTADAVADGSTGKIMTAAERAKLSSVAENATANDADSALRDRTTHTGAQAISTITGLQGSLDAKAPSAAVYVPASAFDGATDVTATLTTAAAAAVTAGVPLVLPRGVGVITAWAPPSNLTVCGAGQDLTILRLNPAATGANTVAVDVSGKSNISISGLTVDGNRTAFPAVTEWKHALNARDITGLTLTNVALINAKGDGLYVGRSTGHSTGLMALNLTCRNNFRNNLSVIDLARSRFVNCSFIGAAGSNPQAGIDLEPNFTTDVLEDIGFTNCISSGNAEAGLQLAYTGGVATLSSALSTGAAIASLPVVALPQAIPAGAVKIIAQNNTVNEQTFQTTGAALGDTSIPITSATPTYAFDTASLVQVAPTQHRVVFTNCSFDNNGESGVAAGRANDISFVGCSMSQNAQNGVDFTHTDTRDLSFTDCIISLNGQHGVNMVNTTTGGVINHLSFTSCRILDNGASAPGTYFGLNLTPQGTSVARKIFLIGNLVGNQTTANQLRGLYTNARVFWLKVIGNNWRDNVASTTGASYNDDATTRTRFGNDGDGDLANVVNVAATLLSHQSTAQVSTSTAAVTVTLPAAIESGATYTIVDSAGNAGTNPITVAANSGQTIRNYGGAVKITDNWGALRLYGRSSAWYVLSSQGNATQRSGTGTPEGAVTAPVGTLYLRKDGGAATTLYIKESGTGNTGWVAK